MRRRRGVGLAFVPVVIVLVVLAITGFAMSFFSRGTTRVVESMVAGEQAFFIAQSAVDEAWQAFEGRINDPADEWCQAAHAPSGTNDGRTFQYEPEHCRALVAGRTDLRCTVLPVTVSFGRHVPLWPRDQLETVGYVRLTAVATVEVAATGQRSRRTVSQWRQCKVLFPSPPRPLDSSTLFCFMPRFLQSYERQYRALQLDVESILRKQERELSDRARRTIRLPRPFADNETVYRCYPHFRYPPFPYNDRYGRVLDDRYDAYFASGRRLDVLDETFEFPDTDLDNFVDITSPRVEGRDLKLLWPTMSEDAGDCPVIADLESEVTSAGDDPAALDRLQGTLSAMRGAEPLQRFELGIRHALSSYADRVTVVAEGTMETIERDCLQSLVTTDLEGTVSVDAPLAFYRTFRCTHRYPTMEALLADIGRDDGTVFLDGIYFVDEAPTVDIRYRGRGAIVTPGAMVVKGCRRAGGAAAPSLCTLVSFARPRDGEAWSSIDLQADVECSLVVVTGMIKNLHRHEVRGTVAVGMLGAEDVDGDGQGQSYDWSVVRDDEVQVVDRASGEIRYDRGRIVVAPTVAAVKVERGT